MEQTEVPSPACRSVFRDEAPTVEKYTRFWITLINQIERGKQILSGSR